MMKATETISVYDKNKLQWMSLKNTRKVVEFHSHIFVRYDRIHGTYVKQSFILRYRIKVYRI